MPEGHSIHRLARQFTALFVGEELAVSSPQGRFLAGASCLDGHTLVSARAHGKQLFLHFDSDLILRVHLGLYGAWTFGGNSTFSGSSSIGAPRRSRGTQPGAVSPQPSYTGPPAPVGAVRVRLVSGSGWADLRGPTACVVITPSEEAVALARLGPDPLQEGADAPAFIARLRSSARATGVQLMDQSVIAGIGNVYRAELLFLQRIHPWRPGKAVLESEALALWEDAVRLMGDGVREGRIITTTTEARDGRTKKAAPHYVYRRTGELCRRCGTAISRADLAARTVYWCPQCQQD
ncbi:DNA-formamidopyrimidine glycosylase family protein [Arthrobacter sp. Br18]|uniref:Fpg/Nei family DNA glycosylase n=1 Tax=Arthrobacter sp. Br18 TaxID=1312954 RepID=UPI00047ABB6E|nr:DNA-formamidopyrimidine glycosylase family protein [Arthrobacter sp. Br18]